MKTKNEEDYKRTIAFLEMEKQMDEENFKAMLDMDLTHLTRTKVTALGKLGGKWKRASNSLIRAHKETFKKKNSWDRFNCFAKEKTWIRF